MQVLVPSDGLSSPTGAGGPGSSSGSGGGGVSPCYGSSNNSGSGSGCCENGRPLVSDPVTGQPVCSCQYDSARLAALSTYPRLTTTAGVYGTPYPSTDQNPYPSIDSSTFYSPLVSFHTFFSLFFSAASSCFFAAAAFYSTFFPSRFNCFAQLSHFLSRRMLFNGINDARGVFSCTHIFELNV